METLVTQDYTERIFQAIVGNGNRLTPARQVIVETLVESAGHITADELAEKVRETAPQVGRMTVYRTLELLCELGQIRPIFQGTGAAHYILLPEGSHHHLICIRCHRVIEFAHCTANDIAQSLAVQHGFQVQGHLLEIHGLCADCKETA